MLMGTARKLGSEPWRREQWNGPEFDECKIRDVAQGPLNGSILLIETDQDGTGGFFLYHHRRDGSVWDTGHLTVEDAKEQAAFDHGLIGNDWREVTEGEDNPINFATGASS